MRATLARELHDDLTQRHAVLAIEVGRAELAAPEAAHAQFVSAHLVVLASASYTLAVWPDAVPPASFRRLCALARWAGGQPPN